MWCHRHFKRIIVWFSPWSNNCDNCKNCGVGVNRGVGKNPENQESSKKRNRTGLRTKLKTLKGFLAAFDKWLK